MRKILVVGSTRSFLEWKKIRPKVFKVRQIRHIFRAENVLGLVGEQGDLVIELHDADLEAMNEIRRRGFIVRTPLDESSGDVTAQ